MKPMILSNFSLDAVVRGQEALERLVEIAFAAESKATHWQVGPGTNALTLFWGTSGGDKAPTPLPVAFEHRGAFAFILATLEELKPTQREPNPDGSVVDAYRVLAGDALENLRDDAWTNYPIVAVQPVWGIIHK